MPDGLKIETWESMNGQTWAVCDHFAILSMHKSREEAEARMEAVKRAREEIERKLEQ
jgi:hypothetical protein